jgi:adenosine deaminase
LNNTTEHAAMSDFLISFNSVPKVELHRHLEGSLRVTTLADIARTFNIGYNETAELTPLVQIGDQEPYTVENFLSKFAILRQFYRTPEIIQRVTREAMEDAAQDQVRYIELRFTPVALSRRQDFPLPEAMDWVIESANRACAELKIKARLIASVNRHESVQLAEKVIRLAVDRQALGVVGIDLAGDEANFPAAPFKDLFLDARAAGMHICLHAGEWSGPENVAYAIEEMQAERIGHGVRVLEDPGVVELARKAKIPFEVCLTSNYQSGIVRRLEDHPLRRMVEQGLVITLNTDDPGISRITLTEEYRRASRYQGFTPAEIGQFILNAAEAAFLENTEKEELVNDLRNELDPLLS